jgi:hypothetical protein
MNYIQVTPIFRFGGGPSQSTRLSGAAPSRKRPGSPKTSPVSSDAKNSSVAAPYHTHSCKYTPYYRVRKLEYRITTFNAAHKGLYITRKQHNVNIFAFAQKLAVGSRRPGQIPQAGQGSGDHLQGMRT